MKKLHLGRFSIAVLLASILATLPIQTAGASESAPHVQVKTLTIHVDAPLPGQAIQLPDTVPAAVRSEVLALLEHTPQGQAVVVASPEVQSQYSEVIQKVISDAGVGLASPTGGTGPAGGPITVLAVLGWIVVIIVIIVIAVIIYVVWKISQLLNPPPPTNAWPTNVNPAVAFRPMVDSSFTPQLAGTLSSTNLPSTSLDIQVNTDLNTTNWWTLATLTAQQALDYTNGVASTIWSVVTARDTNGTLLCSTLVTGESTNTLVGDRPLKIPYPGPDPDKLFLRLRAK